MNTPSQSQLMQCIIERSIGDFDAHTLARAVMTELHDTSREKLVEDCYTYCLQLTKEGKLVHLDNGCFCKPIK